MTENRVEVGYAADLANLLGCTMSRGRIRIILSAQGDFVLGITESSGVVSIKPSFTTEWRDLDARQSRVLAAKFFDSPIPGDAFLVRKISGASVRKTVRGGVSVWDGKEWRPASPLLADRFERLTS